MDRSQVFLAVRVVVAIGAAVYLGGQVRKPSRYVGRFFAWMMNSSHSALTDWALSHVAVSRDATVLDVGCGGGRTIAKLAATAARVYGIDYAAGSVAGSRALNRKLIAEGRVRVEQAAVSKLPFEDEFFDLATAIETQYYWPDKVNDMREIGRVLKPGGRLLVVAESYKGGKDDWLLGPIMRLLGSKGLTVDDHRALFVAAGFAEIEIIEERSRGWLCAMGRKPAEPS